MFRLLRVQVIRTADLASTPSIQGCDKFIWTLHQMGIHTKYGPGCTDIHADKTTAHIKFICVCVCSYFYVCAWVYNSICRVRNIRFVCSKVAFFNYLNTSAEINIYKYGIYINMEFTVFYFYTTAYSI